MKRVAFWLLGPLLFLLAAGYFLRATVMRVYHRGVEDNGTPVPSVESRNEMPESTEQSDIVITSFFTPTGAFFTAHGGGLHLQATDYRDPEVATSAFHAQVASLRQQVAAERAPAVQENVPERPLAPVVAAAETVKTAAPVRRGRPPKSVPKSVSHSKL